MCTCMQVMHQLMYSVSSCSLVSGVVEFASEIPGWLVC